ncbi:MAG: hypothetical protein JRF72_08040 [Deltaproteobacteria bacterium]|jgi:hypothetical protein|nr:hypothetical protein [Deltaproteobacteria bacterium]
MKDYRDFTSNYFESICHHILGEHPNAIGVAYKVLDCGCSLLCGVSAQGNPVGELRRASGQPATKGVKPPICLRCKLDNGLKRVVWEGVFWPGGDNEKPEKELRLLIGRRVFGPGYFEAD